MAYIISCQLLRCYSDAENDHTGQKLIQRGGRRTTARNLFDPSARLQHLIVER